MGKEEQEDDRSWERSLRPPDISGTIRIVADIDILLRDGLDGTIFTPSYDKVAQGSGQRLISDKRPGLRILNLHAVTQSVWLDAASCVALMGEQGFTHFLNYFILLFGRAQ